MATVIMAQAGTGNKNMRMAIAYTKGVGYVDITAMYGCRYDSYNTAGSPCSVHINGGSAISINGAYSSTAGQFRPNSSKNTTLTNSSYWKNWGISTKRITTSSTSLVLTFTFTCSSTANIGNSKFTTTITGITQPTKPTVVTPTINSVTRDSITATAGVTSNGNSSLTYVILDLGPDASFSSVLTGLNVMNTSYKGTFSNLTPNTTYYVRTAAANSVGWSRSAGVAVTTSGNAPVITERDATIGRKYARLGWTSQYDTNASWGGISSNEFGTTTNYGNNATIDGNGNRFYGGTSEETGTLQPNTTYYYKFQMTDNWDRKSNVLTGSFKTSGNDPVINYSVTDITANSATVHFNTIFDTNSSFDVGWITCGLKTIDLTEGSGSITLVNLNPEQTYECEFGMMDSAGHSTVITIVFTTLKGDATGYVKTYVPGTGVIWKRGVVYIKVNGVWRKGKKVRQKRAGVWYGTNS